MQTETAPKVNRSEAIRQALKANPKLTAKPAIAQLATQGIVIDGQLFNTVKFHFNKDKAIKKAAKATPAPVATAPAPAPAPANVPMNPVQAVEAVKALAKQLGGISELTKLANAIS